MRVLIVKCEGLGGDDRIVITKRDMKEALRDVSHAAFVMYEDECDMLRHVPQLSRRVQELQARRPSAHAAMLLPISWSNWALVGPRGAYDVFVAAARSLKQLDWLVTTDQNPDAWQCALSNYNEDMFKVENDFIKHQGS